MSMNIIVFGPPGSGKGTYSSKLSPMLGIPHISTGDIFRAEISKKSDLGKKVEPLLKEGKLVDDKIVMDIIAFDELISVRQWGKKPILRSYLWQVPFSIQALVYDTTSGRLVGPGLQDLKKGHARIHAFCFETFLSAPQGQSRFD